MVEVARARGVIGNWVSVHTWIADAASWMASPSKIPVTMTAAAVVAGFADCDGGTGHVEEDQVAPPVYEASGL